MTRPNDVPAAELEACAFGCAQWLVNSARDADARVEVDPFSKGLTWSGDRTAREAKIERVVRVQFWLQTTIYAVASHGRPGVKPHAVDAENQCKTLEHEIVTRLRPCITAMEGLQRLVDDLASTYEQAHRELFWDGRSERPTAKAGEGDAERQDNQARLLKAAYPKAVEALESLRTLIDRPFDSDLFRPAIPHTLDEWRAARRVLEADLMEVGFTPTDIAKLLPDGAGSGAHRVRMRARRPRKPKKNAALGR